MSYFLIIISNQNFKKIGFFIRIWLCRKNKAKKRLLKTKNSLIA